MKNKINKNFFSIKKIYFLLLYKSNIGNEGWYSWLWICRESNVGVF